MKLFAEWFWIERWEGSSAAMLPMEAQGIYRAMLSHAWRRGASLPVDPEEIQLLIRCRSREWKRSWPAVRPYWHEENGVLVNDTQREVYAEAKAKKERAQARAQAGAKARHKQVLKDCPPSPSPSPTEQPEQVTHLPFGVSRRVCVREPDPAAIDRLDSELIAEEKRFSALAIAVRDSGEDVQAVLDSLPRPKTQTPFSARRWLATGLTGISRSEGGLTVLRLTCDALEARARAQERPNISDSNRETLENLKRAGDRIRARQEAQQKPREITG